MSTLKILHRIYFGFDGKPDPYQEYLKTWEEQLPNYKIVHWNVDNLPMDICDYTKKLFKEKDHTFLGDYFRWWVLREHGGVYLDADIEIINGEKFNTLIEELEKTTKYHSFIGVESVSAGYTAHSMACKKNSPLAQFMCSLYENIGSIYHLRKRKELLAPQLTQLYFYDRGFTENFGVPDSTIPIIVDSVMIYPQEYFSPLDYVNQAPVLNIKNLENICLCHHFSGSWTNTGQRKVLMLSDYVKNREEYNLQQDYYNLQQENHNLQQENHNLQQENHNLQHNKWYHFGQLSRKQKIKKIIVVISKKLKIYPILKYVYKTVRK